MGSGPGSQSLRLRSDVPGARNATYTWHVPAGSGGFNGIVRAMLTDTVAQFIRIEDAGTKLRVVDYPAAGGDGTAALITSGVTTPDTAYDVVAVCDGPNIDVYVNGVLGPSTTSAPWGGPDDDDHDGFGHDMRGATKELDSITVTALEE